MPPPDCSFMREVALLPNFRKGLAFEACLRLRDHNVLQRFLKDIGKYLADSAGCGRKRVSASKASPFQRGDSERAWTSHGAQTVLPRCTPLTARRRRRSLSNLAKPRISAGYKRFAIRDRQLNSNNALLNNELVSKCIEAGREREVAAKRLIEVSGKSDLNVRTRVRLGPQSGN